MKDSAGPFRTIIRLRASLKRVHCEFGQITRALPSTQGFRTAKTVDPLAKSGVMMQELKSDVPLDGEYGTCFRAQRRSTFQAGAGENEHEMREVR